MKIKWLFIFCIILLSCTNNYSSDYDQISRNCSLEGENEDADKEILDEEDFYIICGKGKSSNYFTQYEYFIFDKDKKLLYNQETKGKPKIAYDKLLAVNNVAGTNVYQTKFINIEEKKCLNHFHHLFHIMRNG